MFICINTRYIRQFLISIIYLPVNYFTNVFLFLYFSMIKKIKQSYLKTRKSFCTRSSYASCQRKKTKGKKCISFSYLSGLFAYKYTSKRLPSDIRTQNDINILQFPFSFSFLSLYTYFWLDSYANKLRKSALKRSSQWTPKTNISNA